MSDAPVPVHTQIPSAGVPAPDWGAHDVSQAGISPELVEKPVEEVDAELIASLEGVDVQRFGIYNQVQPRVADAAVEAEPVYQNPGLMPAPVAPEVVSQETPSEPEASEPEAEPVEAVQEPVAVEEKAPKRGRK